LPLEKGDGVLSTAIGWLSRAASVGATVALLYVAAHTLLEITLRSIFGHSTGVVIEFAGYGLAAMTFLALSGTMRAGAHVRVSVLLNFVSKRTRRVLASLCLVVTLGLTLFITYFFWLDVKRSFDRGFQIDSIVPLPAWMPPIALILGLVVFAIDLLLHVVLVAGGKIELPAESAEAV
jgi:TRAP-type C4-dicarboxylate transport system permease small subunit